MKKLILSALVAVAFVGCATYDDDREYRGAPPDDVDVIYEPSAGDLRSPSGLDLPRETMSPQAIPPPVRTAPSGNPLRNLEPAPRHPTEAVPPY